MKLVGVLKSGGWLLSCVCMTALAEQTQLDMEASCIDAYSIRVNHSQVEKGTGTHDSAWLPIEIRRDVEQLDCSNNVLISSGSDLNWRLDSGLHKLQAEPYDSRRHRLQIAASGSGWVFHMTPGSAQETLWLRVANPALVPPGSYRGYIELSELGKELQTAGPNVLASTQFVYEVKPSVSMSFEADWGTSNGTYFNINLGDLTLGARRDFDMVLQSNTDVMVEVSSEHEGYLVHEGSPNYRISYDLSIQSVAVNLATRSSFPLTFEGNYENWRVPMAISVPPASPMMLAGNYVDTIYVDVFPRQ